MPTPRFFLLALLLSLAGVLGSCEPAWVSSPGPSESCDPSKAPRLDRHSKDWLSYQKQGFAWACLRAQWGKGEANAQVIPVALDAQGAIFGRNEQGKFRGSPRFHLPRDAKSQRFFQLFVLRSGALDGDPNDRFTRHQELCQATLPADYDCFSDQEKKRCWFAIAFELDAGRSGGLQCTITLDPLEKPACEKDPRLGQPCSVGQGECVAAGAWKCDEQGKQLQCSAVAKSPSKEECNGKDDDCDGAIDEGCPIQWVEIQGELDPTTGKIDGKVSPYFIKDKRHFVFPALRVPKGATLTASISGIPNIKVKGPVEILGTVDFSGGKGGDVSCSSLSVGDFGNGTANGLPGGPGGGCEPMKLEQGEGRPGAGTERSGGGGGKGAGVLGKTGETVMAVASGGGGGGFSTRGSIGVGTGGGYAGGLQELKPFFSGTGGGGGGCAAGFLGAISALTGHFTPGAGGGGGGGVMVLEAKGDVTIAGALLFNGGDGGSSSSCKARLFAITAVGGGGGGGSGGNIQISSQGQIILQQGAMLQAKGGKGGGPSNSKGGDGGDGYITLSDADGEVELKGSQIEPAPILKKRE